MSDPTRMDGPITVTSTDKIRQLYQVPFHKDNAKSLEALASAYGVNDPSIGKPLSVPQYLRTIVLNHINSEVDDLHDVRGFSTDLEAKLELRTSTKLDPSLQYLPEDVQRKLMAMDAKARKETLALMQAEAMRIMAQDNNSVLAAIAQKLAGN